MNVLVNFYDKDKMHTPEDLGKKKIKKIWTLTKMWNYSSVDEELEVLHDGVGQLLFL